MRVVSYSSGGVFCVDDRTHWKILEAITGKVTSLPKRGFPTYDISLVRKWGHELCDVEISSVDSLRNAYLQGGAERWLKLLRYREKSSRMQARRG